VFKANRKRGGSGASAGSSECVRLEIKNDGSDVWRLEAIAELIKGGAVWVGRRGGRCAPMLSAPPPQVGIIPTDSYPAFVCDLGNAAAAARLASVKDVSPTKPMSILCRGFKDVDTYTMGWPVSTVPGRGGAGGMGIELRIPR